MAEDNNIVVQTERKWGCLAFLLVFVVGLIVGFCSTERHFRDTTKMVVESDTTYVYDTTRIVSPPEIKHEILTDTMLVKITDTLVVRDTVYAIMQLEKKTYKREDFYAEVTGYHPALTYIEVYPKTAIITNTERIGPDKNSISLGINVGYLNAFSFPIYLEYERMLHKNIDIHARMLYDLPRKTVGAEIGASFSIGW